VYVDKIFYYLQKLVLIEDGFTVWRDSERCSWGLARYLPRRKSWRKF
jgi:hypothetical protein